MAPTAMGISNNGTKRPIRGVGSHTRQAAQCRETPCAWPCATTRRPSLADLRECLPTYRMSLQESVQSVVWNVVEGCEHARC